MAPFEVIWNNGNERASVKCALCKLYRVTQRATEDSQMTTENYNDNNNSDTEDRREGAESHRGFWEMLMACLQGNAKVS